jgi:hypothetical protein
MSYQEARELEEEDRWPLPIKINLSGAWYFVEQVAGSGGNISYGYFNQNT